MLSVFKRNDISSLIALIILAFLCKLNYLLHPKPELLDIHLFESPFFKWENAFTFSRNFPALYVFCSICLQIAFAIHINLVANREKFYNRKNYFVALSLILITSFSIFLNVFSFMFVAAVFIFMAWAAILKLNNTNYPRKSCFNFGCFLGVAILFYWPSIVFLIPFAFLLWLVRPYILQELAAYLIGVLTPFYFLMAYFYINGSLEHVILNFKIPLHFPALASVKAAPIAFGIVLLISLFAAIFNLKKNMYKNSIFIRKKWNLLLIFLVFAFLSGMWSAQLPGAPLLIFLSPFSILLSLTFHYHKEKWNIFTFFFLIAAILIVQWLL